MFPSEIFQNIFSYLSLCDVYRLRQVCKPWKRQCEDQILSRIKSQNQQLHIKIGEKHDLYHIKLSLFNYDLENQVVEFRKHEPSLGLCYLHPTNRRKVQVIFDEWKSKSIDSLHYARELNLTELAQMLYHYTFNPMLERIYQFPTPFTSIEKVQYIGDCGMIMSFSYEDTTQQEDAWVNPVGLDVLAVHVNLSWLLSGLDSKIEPQTIYPERYQALTAKLNKEGITDYFPYSHHTLKYIMTGQLDLSSFVSSRQTEPSKLEQLRSSLLEVGVHPRVIWKYGFAKAFILKEQLSSIEQNVQAIQDSENEWALKKQDLLHRFGQ